MALLLIPGTTPVEVKPSKGARFTMKQVQALVGGYVEVVRNIVHMDSRYTLMAVDDDGKMKAGATPNRVATAYARGQLIVGNALLMSPEEMPE